MWRCLWVPKNFPVILPANDGGNGGGGGGGGVEVPVERMRVERRAYERKQKKWKEGKAESELAKEKIRWSDCVVGSGVRWGFGKWEPQNI